MFIVTTKDGEIHEYEGRIDIGSDTKNMFDVVEEHIRSYMKWMLAQPEGHWGAPASAEDRINVMQWDAWALESIIANRKQRLEKVKN